MHKDPSDIYPDYSTAERIADGTMHLIGVVGSIIATCLLISLVSSDGTRTDLTAVWLYCGTVIFAFIASACYHMTPIEAYRPLFRRFDHAGIFLKIAGTYTPIVMLIGSHFSYTVLALVWVVALYGVTRRIFFWTAPNNNSTLLYMGLGWASLALTWPMVQTIPTNSFWLIILGGLTYSFGVIFYKWENLKFSNAIWHVFVVVATLMFYIAIYIGEMAKQAV
ncbi:hemolysin III [Amylibacter sp. SFDW26]|uniref:PAQR family membrane homeostasis protein TrhA n=1 Tax=Amylibacter sp. SFDW26 TaxID=2652722 RepID=UPI00126258C0|nr:hemolysin III family protein [Amylibacter sp. SFDW26]KAB7613708.1 hemolysin III [Amylibacter sp. SFDW26]